MRVEYKFGLTNVTVPCFSVESSEGPQKLFTLATLVLNVLYEKPRIDIIFHSPNQSDLAKKIGVFKQIIESGPTTPKPAYDEGSTGASRRRYFRWLSIHASDGHA